MNLSSSGMSSLFKQDIVTRQLSRSANSGGKIFDPTSSAQKSNHETDKQAEENATWFFEYKALLNSKLTTLTTTLTSAYTTDLDISMSRNSPLLGADPNNWERNAMQGITGTQFTTAGGGTSTIIDPGAMRTTYAYLDAFGFAQTPPSGTDWRGSGTPGTQIPSSQVLNGVINATGQVDQDPTTAGLQNAITNKIQGTTTFMSGADFVLDRLVLNDINNTIENVSPLNNDFTNAKSTWTSYPNNIPPNKRISSNLQLSLFKFFSKPDNYDLIKFGLLDNLYVVGTSSLATGSQVQGSLSLKFGIDEKTSSLTDDEAYIEIRQERFSAFFHS